MARILLALLALDLYLAIPTDPDQLGETVRIVLIALVHANRQRRMRMTCIDAHDRKTDPPELVPKPARHRAGLKSNAFRMRRSLTKQFGQGAQVGLHPSFVNAPAHLIDNAN